MNDQLWYFDLISMLNYMPFIYNHVQRFLARIWSSLLSSTIEAQQYAI